MPLDLAIMFFAALCCAFAGWAVVYLSTKIDRSTTAGSGATLPRPTFDPPVAPA